MLEELFIGMLVEVFSQSSGTVLLTATQKKWRYVEMFIYHLQKAARPAPSHPTARRCYDLVRRADYQVGVIVVVAASNLCLVYNSALYDVDDSAAFDWVRHSFFPCVRVIAC